MKSIWKQMKWDVIMTSLLYIALGFVVLVMPGIMFETLGYLIGALLIVAGAVSMIGYLLRDAHQNYFRNDFVYGLVEITIGIIVLYKIDVIKALVPIILGILVVASGCRKLQDVIDMKRMEYGNWIAMLVLAAVNVIFGIVLILDPIKAEMVLERLIGIGLIISGLTDCVIACYFAGKLKKYMEHFEAVDGADVEVVEVDETNGGRKPESGKGAEWTKSGKDAVQQENRKDTVRPDVEKKQPDANADGKENASTEGREKGSDSGSENEAKVEGENKGKEQDKGEEQ